MQRKAGLGRPPLATGVVGEGKGKKVEYVSHMTVRDRLIRSNNLQG